MCADHVAHDRQTEPQPADGGVGAVGTVEFFETVGALLGVHADAAVFDADRHGIVVTPGAEADRFAGRRILDGVAEQVFHCLDDLVPIRLDAAEILRHVVFEVIGGMLLGPAGHDLVQRRREIPFGEPQRKPPPRLDTAQIEQVVDDSGQAFGLLEDGVQKFAALLFRPGVAAQQLGEAADRAQRGPQLVRGRGDEFRFEARHLALLGNIPQADHEA